MTTPGPGFRDAPNPVDRVVSIASSDLIAIRSFYQRRGEDRQPAGNAAPFTGDGDPALWGFTADSSLPVSEARAELEYSVWVPTEQAQDGSADGDNRLIRLGLRDHYGTFDYGAKFFTVGEAFAANPLARERLNAAGLPGPGEGTEVWASGRLPRLDLRPGFQRIEKSEGGVNLLSETFQLAYARTIAGGTRLQYVLESSESATWLDDAAGEPQPPVDHDRQTTAATLTMSSDHWNLFLKNARFDDQFDSRPREAGTSWQLGGTVDLLAGLAVSPQVTGRFHDAGTADGLRDTSASVVVHTTLIDPLALDFQWQHDRRDTVDGGTFEATAADLKLRAPLTLGDRLPPGLMMTASVGYRGSQGLAMPTVGDGMSFKLTVDYQPGR